GEKSKLDAVTGAFAANSKLFRPRWTIGILAQPLRLSPGARLKVNLTQTQNVSDKPALVKRARLSTSGNTNWSGLSADPNFGGSVAQLTDLTRQLQKIATVDLPIMAEESDFEKRSTLEFERGN